MVLLISEHYFPKIGGTVSYVERTSTLLSKKLDKTFLLVPSAESEKMEIVEEMHDNGKLCILKLGVTDKSSLAFDPIERSVFCDFLHNRINEVISKYHIKTVHLLYGLFSANYLQTEPLMQKGIKLLHTIHNIPPEECSNSWKNDKPILYFKDFFRKKGVKLVNKKRILKNPFHYYIVPSNNVRSKLVKYLPKGNIKVIGHGGAEYHPPKDNSPSKVIQILTVGGFVPHKNQHLIPSISKFIDSKNIQFIWHLVGPVRNDRYYNFFKKQIDLNSMNARIQLHHNISKDELNKLYENSDLYIQLSSEEGFCITVLDALTHRLPVLATPVGAIPEMLSTAGGVLVDHKEKDLKQLILHYITILDSLSVKEQQYDQFIKKYNWETPVEQLISIYNE